MIFWSCKKQAKVIKTKSVKYMPFWLSVANFLNGLCWTTYALLHPFDIYVLVINLLITCLLFIFIFCINNIILA